MSTAAQVHVKESTTTDETSWNKTVAYPGILFRGVQQIQFRTEDRENGNGGSSPLVRGSGGSCNLVQEISFHIVKFS
jgi:hypothetical protein